MITEDELEQFVDYYLDQDLDNQNKVNRIVSTNDSRHLL